jgi:hypothetical protein
MTTAQDGGKVVSLTYRPPLPPGNTPGTDLCKRLSRPQGHSATGRIMSLKNSNDTIGNRTRDLPVCSAVQQKWLPDVFPGGKGGRCIRLTTLPPSCAVVMKSGNPNFPEPSGPLQACNGSALPFYFYEDVVGWRSKAPPILNLDAKSYAWSPAALPPVTNEH